jgi:hypothetical protein
VTRGSMSRERIGRFVIPMDGTPAFALVATWTPGFQMPGFEDWRSSAPSVDCATECPKCGGSKT